MLSVNGQRGWRLGPALAHLVGEPVLQPQGESSLFPALGISQSDGRGSPSFQELPLWWETRQQRVGADSYRKEPVSANFDCWTCPRIPIPPHPLPQVQQSPSQPPWPPGPSAPSPLWPPQSQGFWCLVHPLESHPLSLLLSFSLDKARAPDNLEGLPTQKGHSESLPRLLPFLLSSSFFASLFPLLLPCTPPSCQAPRISRLRPRLLQ